MTPDDRDGRTLEPMVRLATLAPDAKRAERTRQRCRAILGRRRGKHVRPRNDSAPTGRGQMMAGAILLFYIAYLSELVATALRVR